MATLYLGGFDVGSEISSRIHVCLAVKDPDDRTVCIKAVESLLQELGLTVRHINKKGVLFVELVYLNISTTLNEFYFSFCQAGRDHLHGCVSAKTQEHTGGQ